MENASRLTLIYFLLAELESMKCGNVLKMLGRLQQHCWESREREVGRGQKIHGHLTKNLARQFVCYFSCQGHGLLVLEHNKMAARHLCLIIKSNLWRLLTNRRNAKLGIFGFQIQRFVEIVDLCVLYFLRKSIYLNSPRMYYMLGLSYLIWAQLW